VAEALVKLGGAKVVLATATSAAAMSATVGGLAIDGKLLVVGGAFEPMQVSALDLIGGRKSIQGWPSGASIDSEDTMAFSAMAGVRPMTEEFPLEKANEGYQRMMSNKARFRVVLTTGN
jgi:D-arabinose 1-dehydrogenase-like Zn-dependent alcohol dehydrogenase